MIGHTSVVTLLERHGNTKDGRVKARADLVEEIRRRGQELISHAVATAGKSIRCAGGDHRRQMPGLGVVGCLNNGSDCCCDCHDGQVPS